MEKQLLRDLLTQQYTVVFRHLDHKAAECDRINKVIYIDLKKDSLPSRNLLHELFHLRFTDEEMNERAVILAERRLWRSLSYFERWLVNHKLFFQQWRDE